MNFKKLFAATAFAAAVTTAFAVSAFAETPMTASYSEGVLTIANAPTLNPATLLVLTTGDGGTALTNIGNTDIKQIDQQDVEYTYSTVTVGELAEGTYEVRIGGDGTVTNAFFTVGGESPYTNPDRLLGDVDDSTDVTLDDAIAILSFTVDEDTEAMEENIDTYSAADIDESGDITLDDAIGILAFTVDEDTEAYEGAGERTIADRAEAVEP